jgi:hypothetical protein
MCKSIKIYLLIFGLFFYSCKAKSDFPPKGLVQGTIGIFEGNCMPSPGVAPCKAQPISTTVYITSLAESFQSDLLKDSIKTNDKGEFKMKLASGSYSLFIKDGNEVICGGLNCEKVCYCTPFTIKSDSVTLIYANIDHASW